MIHSIEKEPGRISRRTFLKVVGAGLGAAFALSGGWFLTTQQPVQIVFGKRLVRGTSAGLISQSLDQGQTWQTLANFGDHCRVTGLQTLNGQVLARLVVAGHAFWLSSNDATTWRTVS